MKKTLSLSLVSLLLTLAAPVVRAQGPEQISYQGRLTNSAGGLIGATAPENRKVVFRIWNHATNTNAASRLWTEEHTVTVVQGDFSVILGSGLQFQTEARPALSTILNGPERYIEISVEDGTGFQTISPRQQITSTAFALRANVAQSVNQLSGTSNFNTTVTSGTASMNGTLVMNGENQIFLGGGAGDANGLLYSTSGGVGLWGRGPSDAQRKLTLEAKGGTTFTGPIRFGTPTGLGQLLNLWTDTYGLGIEPGTLFYRSGDVHRWYRGGSATTAGIEAMRLDTSGLTLLTGSLNGNLNGIVNRGNAHGVMAQSFAGGHSFGSQDWTTYSRTARNFAWYIGGNWTQGENTNGGGTTAAILNPDGLSLANGMYAGGNGRVNGTFEIGGDYFRIGRNRANQEGNAGTIAYAQFGFPGLSIVGGGNTAFTGQQIVTQNGANNRSVKIWAEGGAYFNGPLISETPAGMVIYGGYRYYNRTTVNFQGADDYQQFSFYGTHRLIGAEFNATSDARIKKIKGQSDSAQDLKTLLDVKITDYTKVDDVAANPRQYKKVIAQEVEKVFPQAVSKTKGTVPDVFRPYAAKGGVIEFKEAPPVTFKAGDRLKVYLERAGAAAAVEAKSAGTTAAVATKKATKADTTGAAAGTGAEPPMSDEMVVTVLESTKEGIKLKEPIDGNLFIYGHEVNDMRVVDYEAISMLNVSATQELHKTIESQAAELKKLREENAALEKELTAARDANKLQDTRLAAIEKALEGGKSAATSLGTAAPRQSSSRSR